MKKRKNVPSVAPGSSSGRHLFARHTKNAPVTRFSVPALMGTGIVLSAATLLSSLAVYFYPLAVGGAGDDSGAVKAAVSEAVPDESGISDLTAEGLDDRSSGLSADQNGVPVSGGEAGAGSQEPDEPHEIGDLSDLDMESFSTEEGTVYSAILDTAMGPMVYYSQGDARWRDFLYGGADPMKKYGCGPTAVAMLISSFSLEGSNINPQDMAVWAADNGQYATHSGSYHSLIPQALTAYGLHVEGVADRSRENTEALLRSGHVLVALMGRGSLTENGHFVLITRVLDNGYVSIADPNRYENCKKDWDLESLLSELKQNYDSGGPLWAVSVGPEK